MPKLPDDKKFLDLSDYARPFALILVKLLFPTKIGAYSLTFAFLIVGIFTSVLIYKNTWLDFAAFLLLIKSMLDAADGEMARQRNNLSLVGRYFDSISDFIVNLFLFLSLALTFNINIFIALISLIAFQLQGSIYNYYYLIKRYQCDGDKTSRIFEKEEPKPFPRDNPKLLKILHKVYLLIYGWQDSLIHKFDRKAIETNELPNWFLTFASLLGLGFQLLLFAVFVFHRSHFVIIDFFLIPYSVLALVIIFVRKIFVK
jgi:phosphatidylglycerophosphate synthase